MPLREMSEPPPRLVEDGRFIFGSFNGPVPELNMLEADTSYPFQELLKPWRLKEWQAFQFGDERWFFLAALYDAKFFSLVLFQAYDKATGARHGFKRLLTRKAFKVPPSPLKSSLAYRDRRISLEFNVDVKEGQAFVRVQDKGRKAKDRFSGCFAFSLSEKAPPPNVVCLPVGPNRAIYSLKALMPMGGQFNCADSEWRFEGDSCFGVLDDHKGFYPYRMRYDWVTGFGLDAKARRVGFNLTDNQVKDQYRYNENCLWLGKRTLPLPPIKMTRPRGVEGDWIVQDLDGMVDLVFTPKVRNDIVFNALVVRSDYYGPFGSFKGFLKTPEGETVSIDGFFGMGEKKYLRI